MTATSLLWYVIIALSAAFIVTVIALLLYVIHEDSYISQAECSLMNGTTFIELGSDLSGCQVDPRKLFP